MQSNADLFARAGNPWNTPNWQAKVPGTCHGYGASDAKPPTRGVTYTAPRGVDTRAMVADAVAALEAQRAARAAHKLALRRQRYFEPDPPSPRARKPDNDRPLSRPAIGMTDARGRRAAVHSWPSDLAAKLADFEDAKRCHALAKAAAAARFAV